MKNTKKSYLVLKRNECLNYLNHTTFVKPIKVARYAHNEGDKLLYQLDP